MISSSTGNSITIGAGASGALGSLAVHATPSYYSSNRKVLSIDDFFKIEDNDLRKYAFLSENIADELNTFKIEDESKISYRRVRRCIKMGTQGNFYPRNELLEWVYYDKKTKKVKISKAHREVFNKLLSDNFTNCDIIAECIPRLTPTLAKKIIEGKINTLEDIARYHRSYTLRSKDLNLIGVYKFMVGYMLPYIGIIEDPENITAAVMNELKSSSLASTVSFNKLFKLKVSEVKNINQKYEDWYREQGKRYVEVYGQRNGKNGDHSFEARF